MNDPIATLFQSELSRGESLLWVGRPKQGLILRAFDAFMIPFSFVWAGAFFLGFLSTLFRENGFTFFSPLTAIVLIFLVVALYVTVGRFVIDILQRAHTYYAVTDERAIIISGVVSRNVRTINLKSLSDLEFVLKKNGRGTIFLGPQHPFASMYGGMWQGWGRPPTPTFELIEDAKRVYDVIREAQRSSG